MSLCWWLEAQSSEKRAELFELGFHLGLHLERMIGNPLGRIGFQLFLQMKDLTAKVEVFGEHPGAVIFQFPYTLRLVGVDPYNLSVLS